MKHLQKNTAVLVASAVLMAIALVSCGGGGLYGNGSTTMGFAPAAFTLSAPADAALGVTTTPTLTWTASLYASNYRVQIDTAGTFTAPVVNVLVASPTLSYMVPASTLAAATVYHWRVIAENVYGQASAGPRTFTP